MKQPEPTVFVVGRFPPPIDGQTLATRRLAELLADGYDVRCASTSVPEPEFVQTEVRFSPARIRHYLSVLPRLRRTLAGANRAPVLWASVSPHPLGHWRDVLATVPAFQPRQPVFAVLHRAGFERLFGSVLTRPTAEGLVRRVQGFVFLNEPLAEACAGYIPAEKRHVIPNTIDDAVIPPAAEVAQKQVDREGREELRLLFLSNMMPEKGYQEVLEAALRLKAAQVPFRLDFAGRWPDTGAAAAFERFVQENGLADAVTHHGPVTDRGRVRALHLAADVFLLPSYYRDEAQPLAVLEALAAGTPVVASRHSGLPYMVRDGREGALVPPRDPEALAGAIRRLAAPEAWQAASRAARLRFDGTYSPESVRQQWNELLAQVPAL